MNGRIEVQRPPLPSHQPNTKKHIFMLSSCVCANINRKLCLCVHTVWGGPGLRCQSWPETRCHRSERPCCRCSACRCPPARTAPPHPPAADTKANKTNTPQRGSTQWSGLHELCVTQCCRAHWDTGTTPHSGCSPVWEVCPLEECQTPYHRSEEWNGSKRRDERGVQTSGVRSERWAGFSARHVIHNNPCSAPEADGTEWPTNQETLVLHGHLRGVFTYSKINPFVIYIGGWPRTACLLHIFWKRPEAT